MPDRELSPRERALVDFEREWALREGVKGEAIVERFGFSPQRYYQLLNRVVARPAAAAYDPLTVRRVLRRRARRSSAQAAARQPDRRSK